MMEKGILFYMGRISSFLMDWLFEFYGYFSYFDFYAPPGLSIMVIISLEVM